MKPLNQANVSREKLPVRIMQFGEGNFLRAFVDWMIHKANKTKDFNRGVVVVQPLEQGMVELLQKQDQLYHVVLEGVKDGQPIREIERVDCIQDAINPYADYKKYEEYILSPELELIVSNTTEAGISRIENEDMQAAPPASFPGKVCQLLYKRFKHFNGASDKGLTFFCCELIDKNASELKTIVLELAEVNHLGSEFNQWIEQSCTFCNTLVDRIVTGFPKDTIDEVKAELGYDDNLVVVGEYFHLWAIEAPQHTRERFPLEKAGLNVVWLDDMTAFRDKKVRILNGAHTALVPVGLLSGHETVKEAFNDKVVADFILQMVDEEVIPQIKGDKTALKAFAGEILERFYNPYLRHYLKDISLNSLSKWMARDYPSFIDNCNNNNELPERLSFSLAALLVFYRGEYKGASFTINDTNAHTTDIAEAWKKGDHKEAVLSILSNEGLWGQDLSVINGLVELVSDYTRTIDEKGIKEALQQFQK